MNKISEYPAQIYMQSENRKKLIESIFNLKNLHIISLWTEKLTKSLKTLFSSFRKVVLTKKQDRQTDWQTDKMREKKSKLTYPMLPNYLTMLHIMKLVGYPLNTFNLYTLKKNHHIKTPSKYAYLYFCL